MGPPGATVTRAKSVRPFIEKLITAARKGDLASRRRVIASLEDRIAVRTEDDPDVRRNRYGEVVGGPRVVKKLFDEILNVAQTGNNLVLHHDFPLPMSIRIACGSASGCWGGPAR